MDLVHVWYGDNFTQYTLPTPIHGLKVKVTDLELYVKSFQDLIISKPYDGFGSCLVW